MKLTEFLDHLGFEEVASGAHHLTEFDERGAQPSHRESSGATAQPSKPCTFDVWIAHKDQRDTPAEVPNAVPEANRQLNEEAQNRHLQRLPKETSPRNECVAVRNLGRGLRSEE